MRPASKENPALWFCGLLGGVLMAVRLCVTVFQAGISILSATHNANPARSDGPCEAQDQSGETLVSMKNSAFDEEELFARAAQAREEMRRLKMPRKYGEIKEEEGFENGDVLEGSNSMANKDDADDDDDDEDVADDANDDDADDDAEEEDDYYDDDSGGFEGAREVGFTAPPKGFKAEVNLLRFQFGWDISI